MTDYPDSNHKISQNRSDFVKSMFGRLADRYDRTNRWISWGQDKRWRREVVDHACLMKGDRLLDIGTGTGDLALEALRRDGNAIVVAGDFTTEMMQVGRQRHGARNVRWVVNDALHLPIKSTSVDAVVSGYLMRNVNDVDAALLEQYRVLKLGGRVVCLETTPPPRNLWHFPVHLYLRFALPLIGWWVSGDRTAHQYLYNSTEEFLNASELAEHMRRVGFREVGFKCFMGESMAIHWGIK